MTVDTGEAAGVGQIMEPLLSALRALTNTVHSGEGEGEDEGGEETVLVGADRLVLGLLSTVRVSSVTLAVRHHEEESLGPLPHLRQLLLQVILETFPHVVRLLIH